MTKRSVLAVASTLLFLLTACGGSGGTGGDSGGSGGSGSSSKEIELVKDKPITYTTDMNGGGTAEITLVSDPTYLISDPEFLAYPKEFVREVTFSIKVKNVGKVPFDVGLFQAHFESKAGQVYDFTGIQCRQDDLNTATIDPSKFVEGCVDYAVTNEAGHLVFENGDQKVYVDIPDSTTAPASPEPSQSN